MRVVVDPTLRVALAIEQNGLHKCLVRLLFTLAIIRPVVEEFPLGIYPTPEVFQAARLPKESKALEVKKQIPWVWFWQLRQQFRVGYNLGALAGIKEVLLQPGLQGQLPNDLGGVLVGPRIKFCQLANRVNAQLAKCLYMCLLDSCNKL